MVDDRERDDDFHNDDENDEPQASPQNEPRGPPSSGRDPRGSDAQDAPAQNTYGGTPYGGPVDEEPGDDVARGPPEMRSTTPRRTTEQPDAGPGRSTPTTAYPDPVDAPTGTGEITPEDRADARSADDIDDAARTVVGVPVGESGIDPGEVVDEVEPPAPPVEARTHEIVYTQQAGFVGARDGPDAPLHTLSTNTTSLEVVADGNARIEGDHQDMTITAMRGQGYELLIRIAERYADRDGDAGGTKALVDVVEIEGGDPAGGEDTQGTVE